MPRAGGKPRPRAGRAVGEAELDQAAAAPLTTVESPRASSVVALQRGVGRSVPRPGDHAVRVAHQHGVELDERRRESRPVQEPPPPGEERAHALLGRVGPRVLELLLEQVRLEQPPVHGCCSPRTVQLGPATANCSSLATATREPRASPRDHRQRARGGARARRIWRRARRRRTRRAPPIHPGRGDRDGAGCSRLRPDGRARQRGRWPDHGSGLRRDDAWHSTDDGCPYHRARVLLTGLRSARSSRREPPPWHPAPAGVRRRSSGSTWPCSTYCPPADRTEHRRRVARHRETYAALCAGGLAAKRGSSFGEANSASPTRRGFRRPRNAASGRSRRQSLARFSCPDLGRSGQAVAISYYPKFGHCAMRRLSMLARGPGQSICGARPGRSRHRRRRDDGDGCDHETSCPGSPPARDVRIPDSRRNRHRSELAGHAGAVLEASLSAHRTVRICATATQSRGSC